MGYPTNIEWTDATWNPVGGCEIHSPGCINCYAQKLCGTRLVKHALYAGTTKKVKGKPVFNGNLTVATDNANVWAWPMGWKGAIKKGHLPKLGAGKPSLIFVGDMADLFHQARPTRDIDRVMIAGLRSPHILQLLTKRADVMARYIREFSFRRAVDSCRTDGDRNVVPVILRDSLNSLDGKFGLRPRFGYEKAHEQWPSPRIWLGFSAERQQEFDERWHHIKPLAQQGWQVFVSCEPLLSRILLPDDMGDMPRKAWIIAGGESGAAARQTHPDWFRDLRDRCGELGLPFFFKQWGEWSLKAPAGVHSQPMGGRKPGDFPMMFRVGKAVAGRQLDGREHDEFPEVA